MTHRFMAITALCLAVLTPGLDAGVTFELAEILGSGGDPRDLVVADFNDDGAPDLAWLDTTDPQCPLHVARRVDGVWVVQTFCGEDIFNPLLITNPDPDHFGEPLSLFAAQIDCVAGCPDDGRTDLVVARTCADTPGCDLNTLLLLVNVGGDGNVAFQEMSNPQPVGACCLVDESCLLLSESRCADEGGFFKGDFIPCVDGFCPFDIGACCLPGGTCTEEEALECAVAGGVFQGPGVACDAELCGASALTWPSSPSGDPRNAPGGASTDVAVDAVFGFVGRTFTAEADAPNQSVYGIRSFASSVTSRVGDGSGTVGGIDADETVPAVPARAAVGDFNGDQADDLAVIHGDDPIISVLVFQEEIIEGGKFPGSPPIPSGVKFVPEAELPRTYRVDATPVDLAVADVDGTGGVDIIVADAAGNRILVLPGNGDGSFDAGGWMATALPGTPRFIATGDLNGDCHTDVAVASGPGDDAVWILLNDGTGGLMLTDTVPVGGDPSGLVVAELTADGQDDFAVARGDRGDVHIYDSVLTRERLHVDADAPAGGDGGCWSTAFNDVQSALAAAADADGSVEVWVASGTYRTDGSTSGVESHFALESGVELYGGFAGVETLLGQRDPVGHPTVLSGDLGAGQHSFHVIRAVSADATARVDGFFIEGGDATGPTATLDHRGGGILIVGGAPVIADCVVRNNAADLGGGISIEGGSPQFVRCEVQGNTARVGAGLQIAGDAAPLMVNCVVDGNISERQSGGMALGAGSGGGNPTMVNCVLINNRSMLFGGGAIGSFESSPYLINCTVFGNDTTDPTGTGGGLRAQGTGVMTLDNCIVWGNVAPTGTLEGQQITLTSGATTSLRYSCVEGLAALSGPGVIGDDPGFVDPVLPAPDLSLGAGSPCVDAADTAAVPSDTADLDGDGDTTERVPLDAALAPRFHDDPATVDTGVSDGALPVVDMGGFEFAQLCAGDVDGSGEVGFTDLLAVLATWGPCAGCPADIDGNDDVGFTDLLAVLAAWGPCAEP